MNKYEVHVNDRQCVSGTIEAKTQVLEAPKPAETSRCCYSVPHLTYTVAIISSEAIQRCKQDLDKQIQKNLARREEEKRDAEARKEQQRKLLAEHEVHQQELKESSRKKLLVRTHRSGVGFLRGCNGAR